MKKKILLGLTPLLVMALASCVMYNGKGKPGTSKTSTQPTSEPASADQSSPEGPGTNPISSDTNPSQPSGSSEEINQPEVPEGQEVKVYLVFGENGKYQGSEVTSTVDSLFLEHTIEMTLKVGEKLPGSPAVSSSVTGSTFVGWTSYDNGVLTTYTTVPAEENKVLYASFSGGNGIPTPNQGDQGQGGGEQENPITPSTGDDVSFAGYGFKFSDGTYMAGEHVGEDNGFDQYLISNKAFAKDQVFQLIDFSNGGTWAIPIDGWSFGGASADDNKWATYVKYDEAAQNYTVLKDFNAESIYIKLKYQQDNVYFQLAGDQTQPSGEQGGEEHPSQGDDNIPSTGYGFKFSEKTIMVAEHVGEDNGFDQYKISDKEFKKYQVFSLVDFSNGNTWAVPVDGWSFGGASENAENWKLYLEYNAEAGQYTVLRDFVAENIYIKLKYQADNVYFALAAGQEQANPDSEPAGDPLPTDSGYGLKFANKTYVQAQETGEDNGFKQYLISNQEFKKDEVFSLIDFAINTTWAVAVDGYSFGGQGDETWKTYLEYDAEGGTYKVLQDFTAESIYIKLKYGEDNIYFGIHQEEGQGGEQSGEEQQGAPYYLVGEVTEWAITEELGFAVKNDSLPEGVDNQWYLKVQASADKQFKIRSLDGATWIGATNIENDCKALVSGDDNFSFVAEGIYDIYLKHYSNGGYSVYIAVFNAE